METILLIGGLLAFVGAMVFGYKDLSSADYIEGGWRALIQAYKKPFLLYLLGIFISFATIFMMVGADNPGSYILPIIVLAGAMIVSGGVMVAVSIQTIKGQAINEGASKVADKVKD